MVERFDEPTHRARTGGGVSLALQIDPAITSDFATSMRRTNLSDDDAAH